MKLFGPSNSGRRLAVMPLAAAQRRGVFGSGQGRLRMRHELKPRAGDTDYGDAGVLLEAAAVWEEYGGSRLL